ncbi:hypothetical protein ACP275_05G095900 [Erythranthe tilingii]
MALEITKHLLGAQSPDARVRTYAMTLFSHLFDLNPPVILLSLSLELSNDAKPTESRKIAGVLLKDLLDFEWDAIDVSTKSRIKTSVLHTLGSCISEASDIASQVVAKIASIEFPRKEWPELVGSLITNMTLVDTPVYLKEATLDTIVRLCLEIFEPNSSLLTPYVSDLLNGLIFMAERTGGVDCYELRFCAYETLNMVVRCCDLSETSRIIAELLPDFVSKLEQTLFLRVVSFDDRVILEELRATLFGVLQVVIQKLSAAIETRPVVVQVADRIMLVFLNLFGSGSCTADQEAMLAIGALVYATGLGFEKYMQGLIKCIETGLQNIDEHEVCAITVGVVGDICRVLDDKFLPYCDVIMTHLVRDISNAELHRSIIPLVFSCFGDIALAIGEHFNKYVTCALPIMESASRVCAEVDNISDKEMVGYCNNLKRSIFGAYSGILQGFKRSSKMDRVMLPYAPHLVWFIESVAKDNQRDKGVTKASVEVLGDLADALGSNVEMLLKDCKFCTELIGECLQSDDEDLKRAATWTKRMIGRAFSVRV